MPLLPLSTDALPRATRRCYGCGVATGPCQCTRQFELFERAEEERRELEDEWLAYVETLVPAEGDE